MNRRFVTADDVLRVDAAGGNECVVRSTDRITPLARDVARDRGVRFAVRDDLPPEGAAPAGTSDGSAAGRPRPGPGPRVTHVAGLPSLPLDPFPVDLGRPEMDVRVRDVVTGRDGVPMAAGVMSLRQGSFPWTLDYDEVEYVLEGELHITTAQQTVIGRPGDVIAIPRGSRITFGTPSWARFLYVTYPADWGAPS